MPKREDLKKILVIGSGPIVIGQAAEFDYAGTQACLSLKEEGYEVVLCNSNPATIMTDVTVADKVYMEPLNAEYLAKIIRIERPDGILAGLGGQTGLNIAVALEENGVLEECGAELLGTRTSSIRKAEDRELFKELCASLGEPVPPSEIATNMEEGLAAAHRIGYPVVLRPAFTLGGTGGGFAENDEDFYDIMKNALELSPVSQVLVEKSIKGFKEIEYEVMRDANDTAITVCNMENLDPVGIHTGDSVVVCPSQTLTNKEYHMLRDAALRLIRALEVEGGCNVQFALDPNSFDYYVIEVNPRVSRSSALASKASGYPIAFVSAKIAVGLRLEEIMLKNTPASFEPTLDYVVTKMPRFPFDKFADANNRLSTQMKATGEVMAIGRTIEESLLKAVRSLEVGVNHLYLEKFNDYGYEELMEYIKNGTDDRIYAIAELLWHGGDLGLICDATKIDMIFLEKIKNIIDMENALRETPFDAEALYKAKKMGFSDKYVAKLWSCAEAEVFALREKENIFPVYKMIDSCAGEFESYIPYFYSCYEDENESIVTDKPKIVVLGSGPIRIGQGVEFDYSTVHAVRTIREMGYEAIIINNNPETVSTDYSVSDKLYFEPLFIEDVMNVIRHEQPLGVIATLGGQTAINLAEPLAVRGVKLIGTDVKAIDLAEDRDLFENLLRELGIPEPPGAAVTHIEDGVKVAAAIGYPVLVRPSFVLGGRAMQIVADEAELRHYLNTAVHIDAERPVLVDKYIRGKEVEIDGVCDGTDVFIPGIMELIERTGVHSGDSISVYPSFSLSQTVKEKILGFACRLGLAIGIVGLFNIQFIVDKNEDIYIIEVNPRSSRTVPFLSKATGRQLADIATKVMLGQSLKEQGINCVYPPEKKRTYVKAPAFSFAKLSGMDAYLSPEMKSTGEAIGYGDTLTIALFKAMEASGLSMPSHGTVLAMVAREDMNEAIPVIRRFYRLGFNVCASADTAAALKAEGVRTHAVISENGTSEAVDLIRSGRVSYLINTRDVNTPNVYSEGNRIRRCAVQNNVTMFTSLDTASALVSVLEELNIRISTINE